TELRVHASPVPTQIVLGFAGSIVIAPIDCTLCLSNTGVNVVPPSVERHTPPEAAPTNSVVCPFTLTAATAAIRPLIAAEPMLRAPRPAIVALSITAARDGGGGVAAVAPALSAGPGEMMRVASVVG